MFARYFPQAATHLKAAGVARERLLTRWRDLLGEELFDTGVMTSSDGDVMIVAYADWPAGVREQLTGSFKECVDELWACLDALVTESVTMFSIRHRLRDSDAPRYFPIADSPENFAALLKQSCVDGALDLQVAMIEDCQPFQREPSGHQLDDIRVGLQQLLDWTNRLDSGSLLGAWATAIDPQISIEPPADAVTLCPQPPGELVDERVVARYKVVGRAADATVSGRAGTNIDLAFPDGFVPDGPDDTLSERLLRAGRAVRTFAAVFTKFVDEAPGSKRLLQAPAGDRAAAWRDVRRSSRRWTQQELDAVAASELGLAVLRDADDLTMIVSTPHGTFERVVPDASPLPRRVARGTAAEDAIQHAAATWGLPDFVLRPQQERKGSGVREVGDGLLIVGERGVVVQAKSRDVEPEKMTREAGWLDKKIASAARQADGTVKQLTARPSRMINGRGRAVTVDGKAVTWVTALVIDHPAPPADYRIPKIDSRVPAVVLLPSGGTPRSTTSRQ
ncbi:hypothetical protein [Actinoplanes sp. NPDC048796]|uniref:hypothetical protein n=1 Tax=Actinoplanes sp. NPDC048796 TaxID=3155640 RepID=UPI0033DBE56A